MVCLMITNSKIMAFSISAYCTTFFAAICGFCNFYLENHYKFQTIILWMKKHLGDIFVMHYRVLTIVSTKKLYAQNPYHCTD